MGNQMNKLQIAWMIPCLNEEPTIARVVTDIQKYCPNGKIYVFDNRSTDSTAEIAKSLGANVVTCVKRGKGNVVHRMFELIEADIYVLVDGDDTYDISSWEKLVLPLLNGEADMTIGSRLNQFSNNAFRSWHLFGNRIISGAIRRMFRVPVYDALSGYRAFSRQFVKGTAVSAKGFEIETEITIHCCEHRMTLKEIPLLYRSRPSGSFSKLNTINDGILIGYTIFRMVKDHKPLTFFGLAGLTSGVIATLLHHFVDNLSGTLVFSFGAMLLIATGIVLNSISQRAKEVSQLIRKSNPNQITNVHDYKDIKSAS